MIRLSCIIQRTQAGNERLTQRSEQHAHSCWTSGRWRCVWEREVRHSGWLTGTLRLRQSDMIVFLLSLPLAVCMRKMHKKKRWQSMKNVKEWCCLFWVLTHALLSFSSASHVFAHSSHLIHAFAGQWGRSCALLCVCGFKADASVCCLPCQSQTPLLRLPSSHPSVYPSANQSSVPLSVILSFLFYVFPSSLCSCNCEFCKLALWKAVPLKELHINVTLPHAFTWFNISRAELVF